MQTMLNAQPTATRSPLNSLGTAMTATRSPLNSRRFFASEAPQGASAQNLRRGQCRWASTPKGVPHQRSWATHSGSVSPFVARYRRSFRPTATERRPIQGRCHRSSRVPQVVPTYGY